MNKGDIILGNIQTTNKNEIVSNGSNQISLLLENYPVLKKLVPLPDVFSGLKKIIRTRGKTPKYPTGLRDLDKVLWGLHKKELLTIGARPSEGKSALMSQMALSMADQGFPTLVISL